MFPPEFPPADRKDFTNSNYINVCAPLLFTRRADLNAQLGFRFLFPFPVSAVAEHGHTRSAVLLDSRRRDRGICHDCGREANRDRNFADVMLAVTERGHTRVDDLLTSLVGRFELENLHAPGSSPALAVGNR